MESVQEVSTKTADLRTQIDRARTHIAKLDRSAESGRSSEAQAALRAVHARNPSPVSSVALRRSFVRDPDLPDHQSEHRVNASPPITRLMSPNGVALQLELLALFVAQASRADRRHSAGHLQLPLEAREGAEIGWLDLVVADTTVRKGTRKPTSHKAARLRQIKSALQSLSDASLVDLPNFAAAKGKYEGFRLLDEGGARPVGDPVRYSRPRHRKTHLGIPVDFFLNGWVYALTKSQIAMWLTLRDLSVTVRRTTDLDLPGDLRAGTYGLSHDAYKTWKVLEHVGLLSVEIDERRREDGRVPGAPDLDEPLHAHRFTLLDAGLADPGFDRVRTALRDHIDGEPMGVAKLATSGDLPFLKPTNLSSFPAAPLKAPPTGR